MSLIIRWWISPVAHPEHFSDCMSLIIRWWISLVEYTILIYEDFEGIWISSINDSVKRSIQPQSHMYIKITKWQGNAFWIIASFWEESISEQWISLTKGQQCGALIFSLMLTRISCWRTVELPMIWDAMTSKWHFCHVWLFEAKKSTCNFQLHPRNQIPPPSVL